MTAADTPPPPAPQFQIHIGGNSGVAVFGTGNTVSGNTVGSTVVVGAALRSLGLPEAERQRVEAALAAAEGAAPSSPEAARDAQALREAAQAGDPAQREAGIKSWLLKLAPAAAQMAGSLVNPVVGALAQAGAAWVTRTLGGGGAQT
jgi:hypothetical protein